jgi:hypothetical protein
MSGVLTVLLAAAVSAAPPLELETALERSTLRVAFRLVEPLPESVQTAIPSGAEVTVRYQIRVRSGRKMWWDRKVWKGEAVAGATFDPVTGRYRCELVLDGVIVTSREVGTLEEAERWLVEPEEVRFAMPERTLKGNLKVRVRAVYSSSTRWLIFPNTEGTGWVEVPIVIAPPGEALPTPTPDG